MDNKYMAEYIRRRQLVLKLKAIAYKGGKCVKCGYNKCYASLVFHHRDPKIKEMGWSFLKKRSWGKIIQELDKCDLVCANCHGEIHHDISISVEAEEWLEKKRIKRIQHQVKGTIGECARCCKKFIRTKWGKKMKYCSKICSTLAQERIKWPGIENLKLLVCETGYVQTGKILGVSPQAIKKRIKRHGSQADQVIAPAS